MSTDFNKLASELINGKGGSAVLSKTEDIKKLASSSDGKKVMQMIGDTDKLKSAIERGDTQTLQSVLNNVINTKEGARLVKQLGDLMK